MKAKKETTRSRKKDRAQIQAALVQLMRVCRAVAKDLKRDARQVAIRRDNLQGRANALTHAVTEAWTASRAVPKRKVKP